VKDYYARKLNAEKLALCYEIAPPRVRQYLEAEINYSLQFVHTKDSVLELGCGYGRAQKRFAEKGAFVVGIDTSFESLLWGKENRHDLQFVGMNASLLGFPDHSFDRIFCIQNGLSAFKVEPLNLLGEALRVAKPGGNVVFSSYSERFWKDCLDWFKIQSRYDLIGEIDDEKTGNGRIVCKDGFTARTIRPDDFLSLTSRIGIQVKVEEVDDSSIFFVIRVEKE